tara:strand:- start:50615 stop:51412 length:798 start_codon:yes stop_codon:yes gene_type:complete
MFKDFTKDFDFVLDKLKKVENFAFTRFSDGELFMLQNKTVVLADNHYVTGDIKGPNRYTQEEHKEFHPEKHQKYRDKLIECYKHNQDHYYKGICTATDGHVGRDNFNWMIDFHGGDHENLTFANLLINANYSRFVEEMVPVLADRDLLYVVNELADLSLLPFEIKKAFLVGSNCQVNNYDTAQKVADYIEENKLENSVVLCSAATLSNYVIYEGFKSNPNNTFLDIGSCLNPLLGLEGWKHTRGYLTGYWLNSRSPFQHQVDRWN